MKVEIFMEMQIEDLQTKINAWLDNNLGITIKHVMPYTVVLQDYFHSNPTQICNQWTEYYTTIFYE